MLLEVVILIIFISALLMVAPSILSVMTTGIPVNATINPQLAGSQTAIGGIFAGGLSISGIVLFGIAFALVGGVVLLNIDFN